jgi:hypothetical protein
MPTVFSEQTPSATQLAYAAEWLAADDEYFASLMTLLDEPTTDHQIAQLRAKEKREFKEVILLRECRDDQQCVLEAKRAAVRDRALTKPKSVVR